MKRYAVDDGGHAELAHAVMDVVAASRTPDSAAGRPVGQVGAGQVGGAAQQFGQQRSEGLNRALGRFTGCGGVGGKRRGGGEKGGGVRGKRGGRCRGTAPGSAREGGGGRGG